MNGTKEEQRAERYRQELEARYGWRYNLLHARLYARLATLLDALLLVGGTAAYASYFAGAPAHAAASALALAIVAAIAIVVRPSRRSVRFDAHAERYAELYAERRRFADDAFADRLGALQRRTQSGEIEWLRDPAYNDALTESGREDAVVPLRWYERAMHALA